LLAPFIGSFAGVVILRHDVIGSILTGRSSCPACKTVLNARDLVPILSWAALRARCRHCGASIGLFYPAMEVAALAIAVWAALVSPLLWASCGLGWTLLALAVTDLKYYRLPDFLTLPLIGAGLLVNGVLDFGSLWHYGLGAIAGYLFVQGLRFIYQRLRRREGMGLGDAKLLAAAGAWVSWWGLPSVIAIGSLLGLAAALAVSWRGDRIDLSDRVPFGAFLSLGLWVVWLYGPLTVG
jgi:leader peptidase (prepilin peptidase)/N-methyltransferase